MKGIVFNILESFVVSEFGEDVYDEVTDSVSLSTDAIFVGPGTYSNADFLALAQQSAQTVGITLDEFMLRMGRYSFSQLAGRHPEFVTPHHHPKSFLKTVDGMIHVEVRKLYSNTELPTFTYTDLADDELIITYFSEKKLYSFMEGLINGVSDSFGVPIKQSHKIYTKEGIEYCDFYLIFENGRDSKE